MPSLSVGMHPTSCMSLILMTAPLRGTHLGLPSVDAGRRKAPSPYSATSYASQKMPATMSSPLTKCVVRGSHSRAELKGYASRAGKRHKYTAKHVSTRDALNSNFTFRASVQLG